MQWQRILIAVELPDGAPCLLQQAAYLARQFHAELLVLHILTAWRYPSGLLERGHELTDRDLRSAAVKQARQQLDQVLHPMLDGLPVTVQVVRGEVAAEIARAARESTAQLVMLSTHHRGLFWQLLSGHVTGRLLHQVDCPVWSDASAPAPLSSAVPFAIRRALCAVDLGAHSLATLREAAQIAQQFGAQLTLLHVAGWSQIDGPGGKTSMPELRQALIAAASQEIEQLQREAGTAVPVLIESGEVITALRRASEGTGSDLLVVGRLPPGGPLDDNGTGLAILRDAPIPVLSV